MQCYEGSITPEEVKKNMVDCSVGKAPGLDGLLYELSKSMADLFRHLPVPPPIEASKTISSIYVTP